LLKLHHRVNLDADANTFLGMTCSPPQLFAQVEPRAGPRRYCRSDSDLGMTPGETYKIC
jgi:hypothetical protein